MRASALLVIAVGIGVGVASGLGCGSSVAGDTGGGTNTGGSGGGSATSSSSSGSSSTTSTGTTSTGTTTSSSTSSGSTSSSSSGGGGAPAYATCAECLDPGPQAGAKGKECKAQGDACFQSKYCVQVYNCVYNGSVDKDGNAIGACATNGDGACCTRQCYQAIKDISGDSAAAQEAIDDYEAMDQCSTCGVCKSLCTGGPAYCDKYAMGAAACQ